MSIQHIIAPVDFSPASRRSLDTAIELAKALGARLEVVHSIELLTYRGVEYREVMTKTTYEEDMARATEQLEEWADIARTAGVNVSYKVLEGDSRRTIVDHAAQSDADLIVIGAKGHSRLHDILIGSVATQVVSRASCSVHLVR